MTKNTNTVDYPVASTIKEARDLAVKAGRSYKTWLGQEESKTVAAVHATREAIKVGYLVDGRDKTADAASVNKGAFGALFGVTAGLVTYWTRLAGALDAGVTVGDDVWQTLAGAKAARNAEIGKACEGDLAGIVEALKGQGWNLETHKREGSATRGTRGPKDPKEEAVVIDATNASDAAMAALKVLSDSLKVLPVEDADAWKGIREHLTGILRREDTLRKTVPPSPATVRKARKATAA